MNNNTPRASNKTSNPYSCNGCTCFPKRRSASVPRLSGDEHIEMMKKLISGEENAKTKDEICRLMEMSQGGVEKIFLKLNMKSKPVRNRTGYERKMYWIEIPKNP